METKGTYSQFDGAAAFSGGGFMPSEATQTADPSSFSSFSKNRDTQTLIPLTVRQISQALLSNDDKVNFLIDGVDVNNVKLVGMVVSKVERVTDVSFALDDGTGSIDCNRWVQESVDSKEMEAIMNGMYVRVHGQLKGFQGKKHLMVFGIKPVTDHDEITHHLVECIYVHSYNSKLKKLQPSSSTQVHMPGPSVNTHLQGYQTAPFNQFTNQYSVEGVAGIEKLVLDYMNHPGSLNRETGVHREELVTQLRLPLDKIVAALKSLESEGVVYTTVDEFHYKSTLNG